MSCLHEWAESIRCSRCGQAIESRIELGRQLDAALDLLERALDVINTHAETVLTEDIRAALHRAGRVA